MGRFGIVKGALRVLLGFGGNYEGIDTLFVSINGFYDSLFVN